MPPAANAAPLRPHITSAATHGVPHSGSDAPRQDLQNSSMEREMIPEAMSSIDRRSFIAFTAALTAMLPESLGAQQQPSVTVEMIEHAERIAGLEFTPEEREQMVR